MLSEKFKLLIEKLINKTNKREIIWSKTHRDDEYMLKVGNSTILIDCWIDDNFQNIVELAIGSVCCELLGMKRYNRIQ